MKPIYFCTLFTVSSIFAASSQTDLLNLLRKSAVGPSRAELIHRAESLRQAGLPILGLADLADSLSEGHVEAGQLEMLASSALLLQRFENVISAVNEVKKEGAKISELADQIPTLRALLAQHQMSLGQWDRSRKILPDLSSLVHIKNLAVRYKVAHIVGVGLTEQGKLEEASRAFEVMANSASQASESSLAYLQKSRVDYEHANFERVFEALIKISKKTPSWFAGTELSSWSAYRVGDYNLALGQLMSLHSPFLADKFSPDSYIVEAATLYKICHFEAARKSLSLFKERYHGLESVIRQVQRVFANRPLENVYSSLERYASSNDLGVLGLNVGREDFFRRVIDGVLSDPILLGAEQSINRIEKEMSLFQSEWAIHLGANRYERRLVENYEKELRAARNESLRRFVSSVERRLSEMQSNVKNAFEDSLAVELEINTRIRDRILSNQLAVEKKVEFEQEVKKGYEFWPFQGEYWRDEIGNFLIATADVCASGEKL